MNDRNEMLLNESERMMRTQFENDDMRIVAEIRFISYIDGDGVQGTRAAHARYGTDEEYDASRVKEIVDIVNNAAKKGDE